MNELRICYIGVWSLEDGLTQGAILPTIRVLARHPDVAEVVLLTLESTNSQAESRDLPLGVTWLATQSRSGLSRKMGRLLAALRLGWRARRTGCNLIIARGSQAGGLAWLATRFLRTPYIVESYEPHNQYMLDSRRWRPWSAWSLLQQFIENRIRRTASALILVSPHYDRFLRESNPNLIGNLYCCPCVTDGDMFKYDPHARDVVRTTLGLSPSETLGVYVGKFGDIYFDLKTVLIFLKQIFDLNVVDKFIFLGSVDQDFLADLSRELQLPRDSIFVFHVAHKEVPAYLSASDLAFSFVKPSPSRLYCSPVKTAEYWASGLPTISAPGISTDSEIISATGLGAVWSIPNIHADDLARLRRLRLDPNVRRRVREVCFPYRDAQQLSVLYLRLLSRFLEGGSNNAGSSGKPDGTSPQAKSI